MQGLARCLCTHASGDGCAQGRDVSIWRVPQKYYDMAREVMSEIDNELAPPPDDALECSWLGSVFLVPPFGRGVTAAHVMKLLAELNTRTATAAVLITNNNTDTEHIQCAMHRSAAICFHLGRMKFKSSDGLPAYPTQGQIILYFGAQRERFAQVFNRVGAVRYPRGEACPT